MKADPFGGLICPSCGRRGELRVTDSRPSGTSIRRRRQCPKCGVKFTTFEVIADPGTVTDAMAHWAGLSDLGVHERSLVLSLIRLLLDKEKGPAGAGPVGV